MNRYGWARRAGLGRIPKAPNPPATTLVRFHWGLRATLLVTLLLTACAGPPISPESPGPAPVSPAPDSRPSPAPEPVMSPDSTESRQPLLLQGTGKLIGTPPQRTRATVRDGDGYRIDFGDTQIPALVHAVLSEGLGLPVIVDPRLTGVMSLRATRVLSREEVLLALETALRLEGAALVDVDGVYHVVPATDAPRYVPRLRLGGREARGFGIHIVPLQYVSAAEMQRVLQPFAPDGGILRVDGARNLLLLAGTGPEVSRLLDVVRTFDVDWLAGMSFGLFPLEYVEADVMASELEKILAEPNSPIAGLLRFVPLNRLSSLLVVSPNARYVRDVETWIRRLDLGGATPGRRIYVYEVQNGKADDLAASLNQLLSLGLDADAPGGPAMGSTAAVGRGGGRERGELISLDSAALKIVPNPENNSILVLASPSEYLTLETALKRLDVLPIQVLIEASIVEVTLTDELRYGVQWSYLSGDGPIVWSEAGGGTINPQFPGFSYLFTGSTTIRAVLNAIESLTDVNVVSSPKLMVLNNREAQLQIGDQVPVAVQSAVSVSDPNAPIVNAVEHRDTGVILRVTPRANQSGMVLLDVAQEVSDVVPTTTSGIDSPTIQQRRISSTVAVRDGETIALGGLIRDSRGRTRSGVPGLQRLPGIGALFRSTTLTDRRTELIVLITPRVLRSSQETQFVMDELRDQFRALHDLSPEWRRSNPPDNHEHDSPLD